MAQQNAVLAGVLAQIIAQQNRTRSLLIENDEYNEIPILERIIELLCSEVIPKCRGFYENVIPSCSFQTFKCHFRVTASTVEFILHEIAPYVALQKRDPNIGGNEQIEVEKSLLITLWALATPDSYRSIGNLFNVSKSTVFHSIHLITKIIIDHLCKKFIKWPANRDDKNRIAAEFSRYGLQNVLGAIDGCHIPIKKPSVHGEVYYNRKKFHSLVLQGICDNNKMFTDVDIRWPGRVHDARVFRTSDIYTVGHNLTNPHFFIIGDAAYPCLSWVMPPFKNNGHLTQQQIYYNMQLSKTRVKIEHAFGLLKGRFRRLRNELEMINMQNIVNTIVSCCVLHNICLLQGDDEDLEAYINEGMENNFLIGAGNPVHEVNNDANNFRDILVEDLWNRAFLQ